MLKKFFFFFFTICYQQKLWLRLSLLQDNSAFFPNLSEEIIPQLFPIIPLFVSNSICWTNNLYPVPSKSKPLHLLLTILRLFSQVCPIKM